MPTALICKSVALIVVSLGLATSAQTRPSIPPADEVTFLKSLADAKPGDTMLSNITELDSISSIPLQIVAAAAQPQFLLSDKPEYFRSGNGIAMQETVVAGRVRLYAYHVPVPDKGPKQILIAVENLSDQPATLTIRKDADIVPGGDYQKMAKIGMATLLAESTATSQLIVPAKTVVEFFRSAPIEQRDILVHRLYEFDTTQPLRVTVAQVDANAKVESIRDLEKLPPVLPNTHASGAGRGKFPVSEFDVRASDAAAYDTASGPRAIIVADGQTDPWMKGTDSLQGDAEILNKGNYGAVYHLRIPVRHSDSRRLAVLMAQQRFDSKWCNSAAAVVRVGNEILSLPRESVRFRNVPEMVLISKVEWDNNAGEISIDYTPPGASCLPTPIILMPY